MRPSSARDSDRTQAVCGNRSLRAASDHVPRQPAFTGYDRGFLMTTNVSGSLSTEKGQPVLGRLFFLDLAGGRVRSINSDGTDLTTLIEEGRRLPDGLAIDIAAGRVYWSNKGNPKVNDGSILRSDLDGGNLTTIVPSGDTFPP